MLYYEKMVLLYQLIQTDHTFLCELLKNYSDTP